MMIKLESERLTLLAFSPAQLKAYLHHPAILSEELGIRLLGSTNSPDVARAIGLKLEKMKPVLEDEQAWITYWLIIPHVNPAGAGLIGFKGIPNEHGEVVIGYGIDPDYQNKGYMTDAVRLLAGWAFRDNHCKVIIAEILKSNHASIRVQQKAGARLVNQNDKEVFYHLTRDEWMRTQATA
jgi:GNAT superfamily N-acetyltransferase